MSKAIEAEQAVIGSILLDGDCLGEAAQAIQAEDLLLEADQALYRAALSLFRQGKPVDPVTMLQEAARLGAEVSREYAMTLLDLTPTSANVGEYLQIVRDEAFSRRFGGVLAQTQEQLQAHVPPQEALTAHLRELDKLQQQEISGAVVTPEQAALHFYDYRMRLERGEAAACVATGYQDLDERLGGGLYASGMYILAGRPGMGKTTLALNIADRVGKAGRRVLFVSLEMDEEQLMAKRIARESGLPYKALMTSMLTSGEQEILAYTTEALLALPVYLNPVSSATVGQIESMARAVKGLGLIVIDYLGKVLPEARGRYSNRYEEITEISGDLKALAKRLRIPVLALCQLNRATADRKDKRPQLFDLRDSGAIEQDADGVIFLHREDYYSAKKTAEPGTASELEVIIEKNRHGATGECKMAFDLSGSKMTTARDPHEQDKQTLDQMRFSELPGEQPVPWEEKKDRKGEG